MLLAIELAIVEAREHDIVHRGARSDGRNKLAHEQARDRRVAVGEMIDVRLFLFGGAAARERLALRLEARQVQSLARRYRVDADSPEIVRARLQIL